MHIGAYIRLVHESEKDLAKAFHYVGDTHKAEPDIFSNCQMLAGWSAKLSDQIQPMTVKYHEEDNPEADRLLHAFFDQKRKGALALLQDLQDLWLMANEANISAIILGQAALGLRDEALISLCAEIERQSKRQAAWLLTRIKSSAPQTLIAAS
ncbi:hypothetical protein [Mucilaginibacter panaciglaebae]|uniref:Uncharacterized protein n=1 Tax=Mucilaginibacter panaciglaebae TaxID=502331 RepID=A0ABP7WMT4_9SPHI